METESWPFKDTWSLHGNREIVSRYQILDKIGEGGYADVYRARRREDNQIVALKEVHDSDSSYREVKALLRLDHPNVIKLYEYFVQGSNMVLVLEYLPSNLSQVIKYGNLSEADVKGWSIQILRGLSACHAASILHRDISPANLLIAEDGTLKIADFGTARLLGTDGDGDQCGYASKAADENGAGSTFNVSEPNENRDEVDPLAFVPPAEAEVEGAASTGVLYEPFSSVNAQAHFDRHELRNDEIHSQTGCEELRDEPLYPSQESRFDDLEAANTSPGKHVLSGSQDSDVVNRDKGYTSSVSVDDGRRYLGVEKMARNGSELVGRNASCSHGSGSQVQDPGCCGWFSSETSVADGKRAEGLTESQPTVKGEGYFNEEMDSGYKYRNASSDESDGSWEDKRGLQNLIGTRENAKPIRDSEAPHVKAESDFRNKFQRFIKKRTRRINSEAKVESSELSFPEQHQAASMGEEMVWKEPSRNWPNSSALWEHSSLTNAFNGASAEVQRPFSAEINTGEEENPLQVRAVGVEYGGGLASGKGTHMDDIHVNDLRDTGKGRMDESVEATGMPRSKSLKYMSNGPLRELAHGIGSNQRVCIPKDNRMVDSASITDSGPPEGSGDVQVLEKSKMEARDGFQKSFKEESVSCPTWRAQGNRQFEETGILSVNSGGATSPHRSGAIKIQGRGRADSSSGNQSGQELGYGSAGSGKIVGTSWEHMGEHAGSLSDAEGTRWFGAPNFHDSYMEAGNGDANSGVRVSSETGRVDSEFEEWEDVAEGEAYRGRGGSSQGTSDRGENRSENGSEFTTMVGTRWYRAPELLYGATKYGMEVDIWAFGCIFGELLLGRPLFPGINDIDQLSRLVRILGSPKEREWKGVTLLPDFSKIRFVDDRSPVTLRNHLPDISDNSLHFLQKVLAYDPLRRPTAVEGVEDEYFRKEPAPTPPCYLRAPKPEEQNDFCTDDEEWGKCPYSDDTDSASEWTYALQNQWQCNYATDSDRPLSD